MNNKEIQAWFDKIDAMTHEDMARLFRFSKAGETPIFDSAGPIWPYFKKKWDKLGGFNPTLSKKIGWEE